MPDLNRIIDSLRRIIRSEFQDYTFSGIYEYAIQSVDGQFVDADPTDTTLSLPSLAHVEMRPGLLGESVTPAVGKLCLVQFINRSPSRPIVVSILSTNDRSAFDATQIEIGGSGPAAARFGDTILAGGMFPGTITSGSTKTTIGG